MSRSPRWSPEARSEPRLRGAAGVVALVVLSFASIDPAAARGQSSSAPESEPARPSLCKRGALEISGILRIRVEGWDWFGGASGQNSYAFPHSLLRIAVGQQTKRFAWRIEFAQDSILLLPRQAVVAAPQGQLGPGGTYYAANGNRRNSASAFVKQAYIRMGGSEKAQLKLGRFEFFDGAEAKPADATLAALVRTRIAQRLLANFGFSAVQRSYDGAEFDGHLGKNAVTLVAARPTPGVYQIDGMGDLDVDVYYGSLTRLTAAHGAGEFRVFGLGYIDRRASVLKTDNRPPAARAADQAGIQIGTYGADYPHVFPSSASGKFDLLAWGAVQTGAWGTQKQRAGAFVGEIGWQPPVRPLKPWLSAGYSYGSGDRNPGDQVHGTFFQVLPTPRLYARMPFYNMENNEDFYGSLDLRPRSQLAVRSELHALRLASRSDLWYLGGGAFQPHTFGYTGRPGGGNRSLANVWDLSVDYPLWRNFSVELYYGRAWGKAVIASIYPKDPNGQFAYIETNFRF